MVTDYPFNLLIIFWLSVTHVQTGLIPLVCTSITGHLVFVFVWHCSERNISLSNSFCLLNAHHGRKQHLCSNCNASLVIDGCRMIQSFRSSPFLLRIYCFPFPILFCISGFLFLLEFPQGDHECLIWSYPTVSATFPHKAAVPCCCLRVGTCCVLGYHEIYSLCRTKQRLWLEDLMLLWGKWFYSSLKIGYSIEKRVLMV